MRKVCFSCFEEFIPDRVCHDCTWFICPFCGACLCTLPDGEKAVAIAVWITQGRLRPDDYEYWIKLGKKYRGIKSEDSRL